MASESIGQKVATLVRMVFWFEVVCLFLGFVIGPILSFTDFGDLCFKRYNPASMLSKNYVVQNSIAVRADGNYTATRQVINGKAVIVADALRYGEWIKANFNVTKDKNLEISISGNLSLCRAYLPLYNLQDITIPAADPGKGEIYKLDPTKARYPIPRIEENSPPFTMIFNAKTDGWRNITQVYRNDRVKVVLRDNVNSNDLVPTLPGPATLESCATLQDPALRASCERVFNAKNPTKITAASCDALSPELAASCRQQFLAPVNNAPQGMSEDDCKALDPSVVDACIASIAAKPASSPIINNTPAATAAPLKINPKNIIVVDSITKNPTVADCSEGQRQYSPICGRYSLWDGTSNYISSCPCMEGSRCAYDCNCRCAAKGLFGECWSWFTGDSDNCDRCKCLQPISSKIPEAYLDDGSKNQPFFTLPNLLLRNYNTNLCTSTSTKSCPANSVSEIPTKFWFTAKDAAGLQMRFDNNVYPTNAKSLGTNYQWAGIINQSLEDQKYRDNDSPRKVYSDQYGANHIAYLQYRFHGADFASPENRWLCFRYQAY
ncbi:MAG UNVERIFIED_CONTAM: hypothetical protein LVR18_03625 [Planctomycetaceae bacterium]|jgi:hypothetical protein